MDRRNFLAMISGSAVTAACGGGSGGEMSAGTMPSTGAVAGTSGGTMPANTTPTLSEGLPLRPLARLTNTSSTLGVVEVALTAAPVDIELVPGVRTTFWAYNGSVPGPLIEAHEGDRIRISFTNALAVQESTVHWHGMPVPSSEDGNPLDPVAAGSSRDLRVHLTGRVCSVLLVPPASASHHARTGLSRARGRLPRQAGRGPAASLA